MATVIFENRPCPACSDNKVTVIAKMHLSTLLQSNPGYDIKWFNGSNIPTDYEFSFVRCKVCNFVFVNEILKENILFRYYNEGIDEQKSKIKIYHSTKRNNLIKIWQKLHALQGITSSTIKVLDFGAGWGDFLAIAKCVGVEAYGLEFDKRKIKFASTQGIFMGDLDEIKKNKPYDIFICNQVLEHLDDPVEAIRQMRSVLKKGAIGFISVPDFSDQNIGKQIECLKSGKLPSKDFDPLGHLNYFNSSSLRKMVFENGFKEVPKDKPKKLKDKIILTLKSLFKRMPYETTSIFVEAI